MRSGWDPQWLSRRICNDVVSDADLIGVECGSDKLAAVRSWREARVQSDCRDGSAIAEVGRIQGADALRGMGKCF